MIGALPVTCVQAMWLMLQRPNPDDFVIATGITRSVKQLLEIAFAHVGLRLEANLLSSTRLCCVPRKMIR